MKKQSALEVVNQHGLDMGSGSADIICDRYTDDVVVLLNLSEKQVFCKEDMLPVIKLNYEMAGCIQSDEPGAVSYTHLGAFNGYYKIQTRKSAPMDSLVFYSACYNHCNGISGAKYRRNW